MTKYIVYIQTPFFSRIMRNIFYLLDYVTRQSEKLEFKNNKVFCLTPLGKYLILVSSTITVKIITENEENYYFETLFNGNKLTENYDKNWPWDFFFAIPDLKIFS